MRRRLRRSRELPVKENDPVAAGDVLVQFDIASVTQELNVRAGGGHRSRRHARNGQRRSSRACASCSSAASPRGTPTKRRGPNRRRRRPSSRRRSRISKRRSSKTLGPPCAPAFAGVGRESSSHRRRVRQRLCHRPHSPGRRSHAPAGRGADSDSSARAYRAGPGRDDSGRSAATGRCRRPSRSNRRRWRPNAPTGEVRLAFVGPRDARRERAGERRDPARPANERCRRADGGRAARQSCRRSSWSSAMTAGRIAATCGRDW